MKEKIKDNLILLLANRDLNQSFKTMVLRVIGVATLFGFTLFLTNTYDPKIIGQYDFIRTFLLVTGSICIAGTDQSILYFAGILQTKSELDRLKKIYYKMVSFILGLSLLAIAALYVVGEEFISFYLNDYTIFSIILKATCMLFFYCVTLFNTEVLRALKQVYIAELYRNTFKYASVIVGGIVLFYINEESYLVDTFLIGFLALSVLSTFKILSIFKKNTIVQKSELGNEFTYQFIFLKSYPMAISTLAIFLLMSFDVLFLKKFKGNETVAFYALAIKLMTLLLVVMNSVNITISPKIAELFFAKKTIELKKTMRDSARMIVAISLPVVVCFCLLSRPLLSLFGQKYLIAREPLLILMIGQGICSFFGGVQVYMNMTGKQNIFQFILILAVVLNFTLNYILVPLYGMNGAAFSYVLSMFFWNFITSIIIYKKDKIAVFLT
nr:MATE family efflux transporter [Flavobacterium sp.]